MQIDESHIARIIRAVRETEVSSLNLVTPEFELFISRDGSEQPSASASTTAANVNKPAGTTPVQAKSEDSATTVPPATEQKPEVLATDDDTVVVNSPMIGTFYNAPEPGAEKFVTIGSPVKAESTVGLVEAMKLFTAVEAGTAGIVTEILVENGQYVEHGQPLMRLRSGSDDD